MADKIPNIPPLLHFVKLHLRDYKRQYLAITFIALSLFALAMLQHYNVASLSIDSKLLIWTGGAILILELFLFLYRQYRHSRQATSDDMDKWIKALPFRKLLIYKKPEGGYSLLHTNEENEVIGNRFSFQTYHGLLNLGHIEISIPQIEGLTHD